MTPDALAAELAEVSEQMSRLDRGLKFDVDSSAGHAAQAVCYAINNLTQAVLLLGQATVLAATPVVDLAATPGHFEVIADPDDDVEPEGDAPDPR